MSSKNTKNAKGDGNCDDDKEVAKVCKWDATAVKNSLDDAVKEVLINRLQYEEDHGLMDGRLAICLVAVAVAMFGLLWDYLYPFPLSGTVLTFCVGTYFFLMMVLTVYTTYLEKGIFVVVRDKDPAGLDPDSKWTASSDMKKFDDMYRLELTFTDGKTGAQREDGFNKSVAEFIDENGVLCMDLLETVVVQLHKSLSNTKKSS